tara:strand:- start:629 stop:931 length:303 start_codon:yes stop_codon:yes gene_type:complete
MGFFSELLNAVSSAWATLWSSGRNKNDLLLWMADNADDPNSWAYIPKWHSYNQLFRRFKNKDHLKLVDEFMGDTTPEPMVEDSNLPYYLIGGIILFGVIK